MENTITLIQSRTVWAIVASAIIWILQYWGKSTGTIDPEGLTNILMQVAGGAAQLLAIYFRVITSSKIEGVITPPKPNA
jgi:hypothetical protein